MFIALELNANNMMVSREFNLISEQAVEDFIEQTNIPLKKELLHDVRFENHLFEQLEDNSTEEVSYMIIPVTVH